MSMPIPERVSPVVIDAAPQGVRTPYLGDVDHGVENPDARWNPELDEDMNETSEGDYQTPEKGPDPIAVQVVNTSKGERKLFRPTRVRLPVNDGVSMLLGQNDKRSGATLACVKAAPKAALTNLVPTTFDVGTNFSTSSGVGLSPVGAVGTVVPAPWDPSKNAVRVVSDGGTSTYIMSPLALGSTKRAGETIHWRAKFNVPASTITGNARLHTRAPNFYYPAATLTNINAATPYQEISGSTELQFDTDRLDVTLTFLNTVAGDVIFVGDWQLSRELGRFDPDAIVNADGTRTTYGADGNSTLWISDSPDTANKRDGHPVALKSGATLDLKTDRAVYGSVDSDDRMPPGATVEISVLTDYSVSL